MSASVSRFPEEILSEIFSLCDTSTALSVARTCRQFNRIVTPKIYHTVHLDPSDDKQTYVSGRSGLFERWVLKEGPPSTSTLRLRDVTNVYNVDAFLNTVKQNARLRSLVACVGYEGLDCYFFYPSDEDDITPEDSIKDLTLKNFFINLFDLLAPTLLMCWGFPIHPGLTHIAWKANSLTKIELSFRWNDPATWEVMTEQFFDDIFTLPTLLSLTMMEIVYWSMFGDTCPHVGTSSVRCLHLITSICPLDENYKPRGLRTLLSWPKALETFSIQIDNWCGSYKNDFKSVSSYDIFEVLTLQKDSLADISVYSRFGQAPPNMYKHEYSTYCPPTLETLHLEDISPDAFTEIPPPENSIQEYRHYEDRYVFLTDELLDIAFNKHVRYPHFCKLSIWQPDEDRVDHVPEKVDPYEILLSEELESELLEAFSTTGIEITFWKMAYDMLHPDNSWE